MADAVATLVVKAISLAVKWYKKDGTARGLHKQSEKVLVEVESMLKDGGSITAEDWIRIGEAVALYPELQTRVQLQARLTQ